MKRILFSISILFCFAIALFAAAIKPSPDFECTGTEPFWSLTIKSSRLMKFSSPEITKELFVPVSPISIEGDSAYVYNTTSKTSKGAVVVTIIKSPCSDSMSDTKYDYKAVVDRVKGNQALLGCCKISI